MSLAKRTSRDVAAEITDLIIRKLEEGVPPWSRPWRLNGAGGRPLRHCGTPYQGINTLYLWALGDAQGYRSRYWMTWRQAETLGGHVRKGQTGALSVYYSSFKKREEHPETGKQVERSIRFLRHYIVFNADQIDGLPAYFYPSDEPEQPLIPSERQAAIDAAELERLQRRLGAGHAADFVYTRGGRLMGYFSVIVSAQHPLLGPSGGVNILLLPEIRGQGLGRAAYLHLLERMRALGLETLHGLTSNPAVIHIGGQIGRRVSRIVMRRDGPFIAEALLAAL